MTKLPGATESARALRVMNGQTFARSMPALHPIHTFCCITASDVEGQ
jgi:hypothetical protein